MTSLSSSWEWCCLLAWLIITFRARISDSCGTSCPPHGRKYFRFHVRQMRRWLSAQVATCTGSKCLCWSCFLNFYFEIISDVHRMAAKMIQRIPTTCLRLWSSNIFPICFTVVIVSCCCVQRFETLGSGACQPPLCQWDFPGRCCWGCLSFLQGSSNPGLNLRFLHGRRLALPLSQMCFICWVSHIFSTDIQFFLNVWECYGTVALFPRHCIHFLKTRNILYGVEYKYTYQNQEIWYLN